MIGSALGSGYLTSGRICCVLRSVSGSALTSRCHIVVSFVVSDMDYGLTLIDRCLRPLLGESVCVRLVVCAAGCFMWLVVLCGWLFVTSSCC